MARRTKQQREADKRTAAERQATRAKHVEAIHAAIRAGTAYLDTYCGRRKVTGYRDDSGWAVTNNTGDPYDQHSFMVCLEHILGVPGYEPPAAPEVPAADVAIPASTLTGPSPNCEHVGDACAACPQETPPPADDDGGVVGFETWYS